jgi:6-phosphofructokinase 1
LLAEGAGGRVVGIRNNQIIDENVSDALAMTRKVDEQLYKLAGILSM